MGVGAGLWSDASGSFGRKENAAVQRVLRPVDLEAKRARSRPTALRTPIVRRS